MHFFQKILRGTWYLIWYLFAGIIVLFAATFGMARLLLPLIGDYNHEIETAVSDYIGQPIKIMSLAAEWHGLSPSLVLNNVRMLNQDETETLLLVSRIRMDLDLFAMAYTHQVEFSRLAMSGANLSIVRQKNNHLRLAGFETGKINIPDSGTDNNSRLSQWILSQGELSLHARNLIFTDQINNNKRYHFSNIGLKLRNRGDRHLLDGSIQFVAEDQQEFDFASDITGDFINTGNWSGSMYVSGNNIDVNRIFGVFTNSGNKISVGKSKFEIWSDWKQASLVELQGDINLKNATCNSKVGAKALLAPLLRDAAATSQSNEQFKILTPISIDFDRIIAHFKWQLKDEGWSFISDNLVVSENKKIWPASAVSINSLNKQDATYQYDVSVEAVRLEALAPLIPLLLGNYGNVTDNVNKLAPGGDLKNFHASWSGITKQYSISAYLDNVGISDYEKYPGFQGLSGYLQFTQSDGSFDFHTENAKFYMPRVFRWEIPINKVIGEVTWALNESNWLFTSRDLELNTANFESKAIVDITIPKQAKAPFISVIANFKNADASKASLYYPYSIMGAKTLKWLDTGIVQGNVVTGGAIVYGPIDEFPFTKGQGVFDVRFDINDAVLDYAEDWPLLHSAQAEVEFKSSKLTVAVKKAKIFDSEIHGADVVIPDMSTGKLQINVDGKITGKTQNYLNYLTTAPALAHRFSKSLTPLQASGSSDLDLKLKLDFKKEITAKVSGKLLLKDNKLALTQIPNLLNTVNGEVQFDDGIISGHNITADILDQPSKITINTQSSSSGTNSRKATITNYVATGKFNAKRLSEAGFPFMSDYLSGEAGWDVKLAIPNGTDPSTNKEDMLITVSSDLKGVELSLPPPLGKQDSETRKLNLTAIFKSGEDTLVKAKYANELSGVLECDFAEHNWLKRGELHFGMDPVVLPDAAGLRISGNLKQISYEAWKDFILAVIAKLVNQTVVENQTQTLPDNKPTDTKFADTDQYTYIHSVDLKSQVFNIFGQKFDNVLIKAENKGNRAVINLDGGTINGEITVPYDWRQKPIVLDMQKLSLQAIDESGGKLQLKDIPAIQFNGRSVNYGVKKLGRVAIETAKTENGMLLQQLIVKPRSTTIKGHGSWLMQDEVEQSSLQLDVDSDDIGKTMKDLGYVETVSDGEGNLTAELHWPGGLIHPDFNHLGGNVALKLKNGRILDIEPGGAARLFGLFSLQTLPRRLTLDFSDIFSKGLGFDSIEGKFRIEDGNAYTSDLSLKGPNADVTLKGRIGLGVQDYDQRIKVTPHITDATMLLSIITNQPLLLFLQQLMKSDIDAASSFEYTLTGPWDHYEIKPVLKKPPSAGVPDNF